MRIFSGIQPTGRKHLGNYIGAIAQYVSSQERGEGIFCIVDLHAITVAYEPAELRERLLRHGRDPARRGARPGALHPLPPERRARAHRAHVAASSVTELGRLQRMHQFRDKSTRPARAGLRGAAPLPGAAGRRRARLPRPGGAGRRGPARAPGADARRRAALQRAVRRRRGGAGRARAPHPRGRRADHGPAGPDAQDVHPTASEQGTVYVLDEPKAIEKKIKSAVTDSGSEVRRAPEKPGVIEPDRDPRGGPRGRPRGGRVRVRGRPRLRRSQGGRRRARWSSTWRPCASASRSCATDEAALEAILARRRRARAGDRRGDARRRARAHGPRRLRSGRACPSARAYGEPMRRTRPGALGAGMSIATLELDLDVFSGPFDLLLDARAARRGGPARAAARRRGARLPRPSGAARRAGPRDRDRVHRADRGAAGAEVAG